MKARFTTLPEWLHWQEGLHPKKIDLGLERVARVAARMGVLDAGHAVISVAGTNGKGSSVAMLEAIYLAAGYRVGSYTSPHLQRYNERVRLNAGEVADVALCAAFQAVDEGRDGETLSYFEFGTLAALHIFSRTALDIVLLEVGLGGRLDAVNVVDPDVALVTAIGIDHVRWLGNDREAVGREKAGIFRAGRPAVCSDPFPPSSLERVADETGAEWYCLNQQFSYESHADTWQWHGPGRSYQGLPLPSLPGQHQIENACGVMMVLELLQQRFPVSQAAINTGLRSIALAARFQVIPGAVEMILDVAHNPHGARRLAEALDARPCRGQSHCVIGMLDDKDARGVANALSGAIDQWYPAGLDIDRGLSSEALSSQLRDLLDADRLHPCSTVGEAIQVARDNARQGDRIIVCGSFHTVAEAGGGRV
jgi:dihydrofolate synthase/folylpolyglutamate synthase